MTASDPIAASFNMAAYVLRHAKAQPDKAALEILHANGADVWTYAKLEQAVHCFAAGLVARGIRPQDRILLRLGNTALCPIAYLGCILIGAIPVPLSSQLSEPELDRIKAEIDPSLILADTPNTSETAVHEIASTTPLPAAQIEMGDPDRPAYFVYTSGTSGTPRAVMHAHRAVWARRRMWDGWYGLRSDDRLLHAGAFNWTFTMGTGLMDPWAIGATALIPAPDTPADALPTLLADHNATLFAAAPAIYRRMLRAAFPPLPSLRHGLSAGEAMSPTLQEDWQAQTGCDVHQAYGLSECSTFISSSPARAVPSGAIGMIQEGRQVQLMPDTGEIAIHRTETGLMLGYWQAPQETADRFQGDWFLTGDLGRMETSGAITYLGRRDDMLNAGGTRVSPIEIETALTTHPQIAEFAACEVRLTADLSLIAGFYVSANLLDVADLDSYARTKLADYKVPKIWVHLPRLPRGSNNKLLRRKLRQDWEATHGQA